MLEIVVLMENTAKEGLLSEHGLSLLIRTKKHTILFDMGQSDAFITNATRLGIDLSCVDIAVLSHGHYDHGGGLSAFLEKNQTAKVYVNENAFSDYFSEDGRFLGLPYELKTHPQLIFTKDEEIIDEELTLFTGNNNERPFFMEHFGLLKRTNGQFSPDDFLHEQYLLICEHGEQTLISGCSHKGILNILEWVKDKNIRSVIGGFHYMKLDNIENHDFLYHSAQTLKKYPAKFYTCHCTGLAQYNYLKDYLGDQIEYINAGTTLSLASAKCT